METTFIFGNYKYTIINSEQVFFGDASKQRDCAAAIVDWSKIEQNVVIPSHANDGNKEYEVVTIVSNVFCNYDFLIKTIFIPYTVETINARAFCNIKYLEEVMFEENSKLKTLSYEVFHNCVNLKRIILPPSLKNMSYGVFGYFVNLSEIHYCGRTIFNRKDLVYPKTGANYSHLKIFVVFGLYKSKYFGNVSVIYTSKCIYNSMIRGNAMTCKTARSYCFLNYIMFIIIRS